MKFAKKLFCLTAALAMLVFVGQVDAQDCASGTCGGGSECESGTCGGGGAAGGALSSFAGALAGNNGNCGTRDGIGCAQSCPSKDCIGAVGPLGQRYLAPEKTLMLAAQDHYSPNPLYSYSPTGLDATRMDYWNRNVGAAQNSWHGNYNHWRYGAPTALVVPPTAAFQTEYNWGVGQTRSIPIYHQFTGGANAGYGVAGGGGGGGGGMFRNRPYWPSSTSQFGIYPVRGRW